MSDRKVKIRLGTKLYLSLETIVDGKPQKIACDAIITMHHLEMLQDRKGPRLVGLALCDVQCLQSAEPTV
jgi:hypothetical protein